MFFGFSNKPNVTVYKARRESLLQAIKNKYGRNGALLLISNFERENVDFIQESSFYYLTGINEPGVAMLVESTGNATVYIPYYQNDRASWKGISIEPNQQWATQLGVDSIEFLGDKCAGFFGPFFDRSWYVHLIDVLKEKYTDANLYTLMSSDANSYVEQRMVLMRLQEMVPFSSSQLVDISALVADLRSSKDIGEIELINDAIIVTIVAHEAAAHDIGNDITEKDVQASVEGVMIMAGTRKAFPSIIASGKNSTILNYTQNDQTMKAGDVVIVDIGASFYNYAAEITRTYPVSGTFTRRQREVYDIVLAAQDYIAHLIQPGFYFNNKEYPEKSMYHLAQKFFADRGYAHYFVHTIGHFVGLDVCDVGDYQRPLREGDIITLEPSLYIPEEQLGIRIEDMYWIIKKGAVCLSENLPKDAEDIELFMQGRNDEVRENDFEDNLEEEDFEEGLFESYDTSETEH